MRYLGCFFPAKLHSILLRVLNLIPYIPFMLPGCFGFGCRRQQKRHAAAPPPAGVWRRMKRKRHKLVGRDKGSLTEQQTEGNRNNNDTDKEKTRQKTRPALSDHTGAARSRATRVSSRRAPPHRNPA